LQCQYAENSKFEFGGFDPKLQLDMLDQLDKNQGDHIHVATFVKEKSIILMKNSLCPVFLIKT
jgi:hypothetical protein